MRQLKPVPSVQVERPRTPYDPDRARVIRDNIRRVWDRQKQTRNLTQAGLATELGLTQGAVSKLLADADGTLWTISKLLKFIDYCRIEPSDIFGPDAGAMVGYLSGWKTTVPSPKKELIDECRDALIQFFQKRKQSIGAEQLERLAVKVAFKVQITERTANDFDNAMLDAIMEEAAS